MTEEEAVAALKAMDGTDPEAAHVDADRVLLDQVPASVRKAYWDLEDRAGGFWYA
jgi:hypothetical protein